MDKQKFELLLSKRLSDLYGNEIPEYIIGRYKRELTYLNNSQYQKEFIAFCELIMLMKMKGIKHDLVGTTASHSFLLYLLDITQLNPLPPHYYCPNCEKRQFVSCDIELGIDLPQRTCQCGHEMEGEGFDLNEEMFWDREPLELMISISENDYGFVRDWLSKDKRLMNQSKKEEKISCEEIVNRFEIGIVVVLGEDPYECRENTFGWSEVRKYKERILKNYTLFLPCSKKIKIVPENLYELIRLYSYFHTVYVEREKVGRGVSVDDVLEYDEMGVLLEELYNNDIYKVPVFLEEGLALDEWCIENYKFTIMFSRAYAERFLDDVSINLKKINCEGDERK